MELTYEVVRVLDESSLINSESYQCHYDTGYGDAMVPGYYIVVWAAPFLSLRYDDTGRFFGPFASKTEAEDFVLRATFARVEHVQPGSVSASLH